MQSLIEIGRHAEAQAALYLQQHGYKLYARNVRLGRDEIDIIAYDPTDRVVVFVEVKARSVPHHAYTPELNMTAQKKRALRRAMDAWVSRHQFLGGYRLDYIGVVQGVVHTHVQQIDLLTAAQQ